jgi:methylthioribose-1-phosphate isomerase
VRSEPIPPTIEWADGAVRLIDQRQLPGRLVVLTCTTVDELCGAIRSLAIRGAPALGAAGALGVALAKRTGEEAARAAARLLATRPTAVTLAWGVERALAATDPLAEALQVLAEDLERNRSLGAAGAGLLPERGWVLTHCNTGALACVGYGTALGVIRAAHEQGRRPSVWVDETRPVLQGSRLTAWELDRLGIPYRIIPDGLAASLMARGEVAAVVVGADRIAANGDVANKVGTYGLALAACHCGVPFYVAAPLVTFDLSLPDGDAIPIERRADEEVLEVGGQRLAPPGAKAENRAFDVTPASLVTAFVTEAGVRPPADPVPAPRPDG